VHTFVVPVTFPHTKTFLNHMKKFLQFLFRHFLGSRGYCEYFCGQINFSSIAKKSACRFHFWKNSLEKFISGLEIFLMSPFLMLRCQIRANN
jgi:hypothetical protein